MTIGNCDNIYTVVAITVLPCPYIQSDHSQYHKQNRNFSYPFFQLHPIITWKQLVRFCASLTISTLSSVNFTIKRAAITCKPTTDTTTKNVKSISERPK